MSISISEQNKRYIETLMVLGAIPNCNMGSLIESEIDIRNYHDVASKFMKNFEREVKVLEFLDLIYDGDYEGLNKFVDNMKTMLRKFIWYNKDERMLKVFAEHIYSVVSKFKHIIMEEGENTFEEMSKALKLIFNPKFVKLDKLYKCEVEDSHLRLYTSTMSLYESGKNIAHRKDIGMIEFKNGNIKVHEVTENYDKVLIWRDIKKNFDNYDFVYVCNKDNNLDKLVGFMEYLNSDKEYLGFSEYLELDKIG